MDYFGVFIIGFIIGIVVIASADSDMHYDKICNDFALYEPQHVQSLTYKKYCKDKGE